MLSALLNTASGATWVSLHHGGGVGMGHSQYSGVVIVCDGTVDTSEKLGRVLFNDPASCAVPMRAVTSQGKAPKTTT